ncbi:hypothetical protein [Kibdelosporangium philippinense]|uniref:hypothetical protein n=1 Tax=Kibdelosporangium philippinense TaxID=211113 RepID=UPI00361E8359
MHPGPADGQAVLTPFAGVRLRVGTELGDVLANAHCPLLYWRLSDTKVRLEPN